jgi:FAD/FMN-containing dehydrogenase
VGQRPAAIALPESAAGVIATVSYARRHGLRVAAQRTGHTAAPLGLLDGTVLVKTSRLPKVSIDPVARAEAGAVWPGVVGPAAGYRPAGPPGTELHATHLKGAT